MKKFKFFKIITLSIFFSLLMSCSVFAATNGPHDIFNTDNALCTNCHTIWTNAKNGSYDTKFASQNDYYNTCAFCHCSTGSSKYDAIYGTIYDSTANAGVGGYYRLPGGGFSKHLTTPGTSSLIGKLISVTSIHDVKPLGTNVAPGGNTTATFLDFSCRNCHDPHGTTNSRSLLVNINGKTNLAPTLIVNNELKNEIITYISGFDDFCGACHGDFNVKEANSGGVDNGIYTRFKRHRVSFDPSGYPGYNPNHGLPLESGKMTCMTCHNAHSTAVTNGVTFDRAATYNGTNTSTSSTLLRKNNRGVCQTCHGY